MLYQDKKNTGPTRKVLQGGLWPGEVNSAEIKSAFRFSAV